jgi:Tol biopolymer transport system component
MGIRHAPKATLVLVSAIALLTLAGSSAQAAFPGRNGRIAFVRSTPGERDVHIWTMEADGSSQKRLLARHGVAPAWSPHGTRIAFDNWIWEPGTITVADADGSNVRTLTQGRDFRDPSWSPNGRQIVFNGLTDAYRIMIVNSDDGRITFRAPLLRHHKTVDRPRWSPRGDRIAFEVGPYRPGQDNSSEVFTMTPEGEDLRQLTDNRASEYDLDCSPDGSRLLYVRIRNHNNRRIESDIAVMGKNGHDVSILTHTERNEGSAAFSPNGRRIVFDRCCYGQSQTSEIFVMRADGTHVVRLTNNEVDDTAPDWQPVPHGS